MLGTFFNLTPRLVLLLALIIGAAYLNAVFAQGGTTEGRVAQIRKLYADVNAQIAEGLKERGTGLHHAMFSVGGDKDGMGWRAVGTMLDRTEFYFDCEPDADEECGTDPRKFVVKITNSYRAAADLASNAEYLFNEQDELVFVLERGNMGTENSQMIERRFYFASGKLIRVVRGAQTIDRNFSNADTEAARDAQQTARDMLNVFALMVGEMK